MHQINVPGWSRIAVKWTQRARKRRNLISEAVARASPSDVEVKFADSLRP
jgi:hypothetical protein